VRKKLTRVLEATVNGPSGHGSRHQTGPRPQPDQGFNGVTGGTPGHFSRPYGAAQRHLDWSASSAARRTRARRNGPSSRSRTPCSRSPTPSSRPARPTKNPAPTSTPAATPPRPARTTCCGSCRSSTPAASSPSPPRRPPDNAGKLSPDRACPGAAPPPALPAQTSADGTNRRRLLPRAPKGPNYVSVSSKLSARRSRPARNLRLAVPPGTRARRRAPGSSHLSPGIVLLHLDLRRG
jgi:hypothetical protein